jgi:hypothetical protein
MSKLKTALVAFVVMLSSPAVAQAASTLALPTQGKVDELGRVAFTLMYSCPASTSTEDSILWLYSTQDEPFAAGDTAVLVTCDGKRHRYQAIVSPNIGELGYSAGTLFIEAFLGAGGDSILASDSAYLRVR